MRYFPSHTCQRISSNLKILFEILPAKQHFCVGFDGNYRWRGVPFETQPRKVLRQIPSENCCFAGRTSNGTLSFGSVETVVRIPGGVLGFIEYEKYNSRIVYIEDGEKGICYFRFNLFENICQV